MSDQHPSFTRRAPRNPDAIATAHLCATELAREQGLARQIDEVTALRAAVGRLPVGTRISWRTEFDAHRRTDVIAERVGDLGYRMRHGAFVLWKSHAVKVEK